MIAFVAPGQGSEYRGMGLSLAAQSRPAADVLQQASDALGRDLSHALERGGRDLLRADVAQVAVAAVALGAAEVLRDRGLRPSLILGHSAGELAAASVAGHFSARDALDVYVVRAREMAAAAKRRRGGMASLEGGPADLLRALERGAAHGVLVQAGRVAPDRWLVSGDEQALRHASATEPLSRLDVGGAWHSPLMEPAMGPYRAALLGVTPATQTPRALFLSNDNAQPVAAEEVVPRLCAQLTRPMRFSDTLNTLAELAPTDVIFLGPSRTLRVLFQLNFGPHPPFRVHGTESPEEVAGCLRALTRP